MREKKGKRLSSLNLSRIEKTEHLESKKQSDRSNDILANICKGIIKKILKMKKYKDTKEF